jgi:RNA polymerase sigma-70 factor (ECF subfamily)
MRGRPKYERTGEKMPANEAELRRLMVAGQNGDNNAYRALLEALSAYLRGYYKSKLLGSGRGAADAEDLVQDTLMAIHTRRDTYDPSQPFTPWMHAIARYKLIDHLRRKDNQAHVALDALPDLTTTADNDAGESKIDLVKLLDRLPEKMSRCIRRVKIEGQSVAATAEQFGMSESAVKINIHRGMRALAAFVSGESQL